MTFRPQNECDHCGYTWHPRGKDRSLRCPNCRSLDIIQYEQEYDIFENAKGIVVLLFVGFIGISLLIAAATHEKEEESIPLGLQSSPNLNYEYNYQDGSRNHLLD